MPWLHQPEEKAELLKHSRVIAVLGLSDNPTRPAYGVAQSLQRRGARIIPIHPAGGTVLGEAILKDLKELPAGVDLLDVFRNPAHLPGIIDELLALPVGQRPKALWFQDGVVDEAAGQRAVDAGWTVVMDDCTGRTAATRNIRW